MRGRALFGVVVAIYFFLLAPLLIVVAVSFDPTDAFRFPPPGLSFRWYGAFFANAGEDLHAVGSLAPLIPGHIGCIVIRPDGSRTLARAVPDPAAQ